MRVAVAVGLDLGDFFQLRAGAVGVRGRRAHQAAFRCFISGMDEEEPVNRKIGPFGPRVP